MKKQKQLGMNPSTASSRLIKDILFKFINDLNLNTCFHCNTAMNRDNFSIEHKTPWLDSTTPKQLFFDLDNISFSHLSCNVSHSRKPHKWISNPVCVLHMHTKKGADVILVNWLSKKRTQREFVKTLPPNINTLLNFTN